MAGNIRMIECRVVALFIGLLAGCAGPRPITPRDCVSSKEVKRIYAEDAERAQQSLPPAWIDKTSWLVREKDRVHYFGVGFVEMASRALGRTAAQDRARAALSQILASTVTIDEKGGGRKITTESSLQGAAPTAIDHFYVHKTTTSYALVCLTR